MVALASTYRYAPLASLRAALGRTNVDLLLTAKERGRYDAAPSDGWLAGRMLAKQLILDQLQIQQRVVGASPHQIDIDSGDVGAGQYRPRVSFAREPLDWSLSISHTPRAVLVALSTANKVTVGVDLAEHVEHGRGFANMWFSEHERRCLDIANDARRLSTGWAIKEAVYKACNRGEPFRPRDVRVEPTRQRQYDCIYRGTRLSRSCAVRCWNVDDHVAVMVVNKRPGVTKPRPLVAEHQ